MTLPPVRETASPTLLDLLTADTAAGKIAVLPPLSATMFATTEDSAPARVPAARAGLATPLLLAARLVLRRPRVRQLALRILKRFPALYARAYQAMMASGSAPSAPAQPDPGQVDTLSPRANAILRSLRSLRSMHDTPARPAGARRRLAFVAPLPPERTGVATYSVELLAELTAHFDIELVVAQLDVTLPPALAHLPVRQAAWFAEHGGQYDQVLYQFGNSPFHSHMFALLARWPGVVVLHDFFLGGALVHAQMSGAAPAAWADALLYSHGYAAVRATQTAQGRAQAHKDWPASLPVLDNATRVIVHSQHARQLAADWFGAAITDKIDVIPHPRTPPAHIDRAGARAALGIDADTFLVCSFGFVAPNKLTHELLRAWIGSHLHADRRCALVLAGANHDSPYGVEAEALIRAAGPDANIRIAGWLDADVYRQYLQAADVGVQLRTNAHGESSGAVLDCMNYGLPTIVNANGSMAEFPPDAVRQLPDAFTESELGAVLEALRADPGLRAALGQAAVALLDARFRPARCAGLYLATLASARAAGEARDQAWRTALARAGAQEAGADDTALERVAATLAEQEGATRRQLLVDVSAWAAPGAVPDPLAAHQLRELLAQAHGGLRVEPVRLDTSGALPRWRLARGAAGRLLGLGWTEPEEPVVDLYAGDIFYAPDAASAAVAAAFDADLLSAWRARGVSVRLLVRGADHGALPPAAAAADHLLCLSEAIAQQLTARSGA